MTHNNTTYSWVPLPQTTPSLHGLSVMGLAGQAESGIGTPVLGTTHFTFRVCLPPWQVSEHWWGVVGKQDGVRVSVWPESRSPLKYSPTGYAYIISTAKPSAFMKKRFRKLMHSTETLVHGLLIYMIKCVSIPFLIMHFRSIWLLHTHAYYWKVTWLVRTLGAHQVQNWSYNYFSKHNLIWALIATTLLITKTMDRLPLQILDTRQTYSLCF